MPAYSGDLAITIPAVCRQSLNYLKILNIPLGSLADAGHLSEGQLRGAKASGQKAQAPGLADTGMSETSASHPTSNQ